MSALVNLSRPNCVNISLIPIVGNYLTSIGGLLAFIGGIVYFFDNKRVWSGRLPGTIRPEGRSSGSYFCIVISLVLNLIIVLIRRFFGS